MTLPEQTTLNRQDGMHFAIIGAQVADRAKHIIPGQAQGMHGQDHHWRLARPRYGPGPGMHPAGLAVVIAEHHID
ncbi:MAG: hypothetical protein K9N49_02235 [Candidatus Marinimicrobia bacterium]|nr:hypothetical protein [Candidatus Neomarinimicrobiota bacterium]